MAGPGSVTPDDAGGLRDFFACTDIREFRNLSVMKIALDNLPTDPVLLQKLVRDMACVLQDSEIEIGRLRQIIRDFQRARFGQRSEQMSPAQFELGLEDLEADLARLSIRQSSTVASMTGTTTADCAQRGPLPEHLPRERMIIPTEMDACPRCGGPLHDAGTTVSEMLDWTPASLRVRQIVRPKCACRACGTLHQAAAPERLADGCLATPGLVAHVLISRYCDHLPLYRQSGILARHGVNVPRSTLAGWVGAACWWLEPLRDRLMDHILQGERLFADDTPLPVLDPGRGRTKTGRFWAYTRDDRTYGGTAAPAVAFRYEGDRRGTHPATHLKGYQGIVQVDGYAGFEALREGAGPTVTLAACWSHMRRKFYDLHKTGSPLATEALSRVAALYAIEAEIRGQAPDARKAVRQDRTRPLVEALHFWLTHHHGLLPTRSRLAEAMRYALNRWHDLIRFLDDGRIDLDTNPVERAIRPIALGRKNALFAGSEGGADRWAIVASLIETAKLNGIEPFTWLSDTLTRMVDGQPISQIERLLPI